MRETNSKVRVLEEVELSNDRFVKVRRLPLPKPNLDGGKKVGLKSKKNVELHNNFRKQRRSSWDGGEQLTESIIRTQRTKEIILTTTDEKVVVRRTGEAEAEKAGDGSTSGDIFHDALAPEEAQQKAAKRKRKSKRRRKRAFVGRWCVAIIVGRR